MNRYPGTAQYGCCAPNPCGDGFKPVGEYATWCGKVNVHKDTFGAWEADGDCSSGCNNNSVTYCQKFWPASTKQVPLTVDSVQKPFYTGGCGTLTNNPGTAQYACCVPD